MSFVSMKFIIMGIDTFYDCVDERSNRASCEHARLFRPATLNGNHPIPDSVFVGPFDGKDWATAHAIDIRQCNGFAIDRAGCDGDLCVKPMCTPFEHTRRIIDPPNWQNRSAEADVYIALTTVRGNAYLRGLLWKAEKEIAVR